VHKIEFGDYGSKYLRLGDLDGDGRHDVLVVQVHGLYSRGFHPAGLVDGYGREIASFPFPPAIIDPKESPPRYDDYYAQHVSVWGDEREEVLVFNHKALYVYANAAVWQKPRLYNNTYYPGRL
jgi:hypothetical protein